MTHIFNEFLKNYRLHFHFSSLEGGLLNVTRLRLRTETIESNQTDSIVTDIRSIYSTGILMRDISDSAYYINQEYISDSTMEEVGERKL
jgi:hypothetical protein